MLIGAAMSNGWLLPGQPHGRALSQAERMLILFNPADFVLHFYPKLWGRGGPEALGATGMALPARLGPDRQKVKQVNVRSQLNRRHGWDYIADSQQIMSMVRRELVLRPAEANEK